MKKKKRDKIVVFLIFVILTVFTFRNYFLKGQIPFPSNLLTADYSPWKYYAWEGYPNGPPNKPIGFDNLRQHFPYRKFTVEELKKGFWPLWNPYNFSGNVHLANYQSSVFYPLNIVYFVLPMIEAWSVLVMVQPILAGYFTYLFLKELKLSVRASFFGSLVFAFSGWMIVWLEESLVIEHSALWLPLILYSVERLLKKFTFTSLFWFVFGLTSSILAGFLQSTFYAGMMVLGWIIFRWMGLKKKSASRLWPFLLGGVLSLLVSAAHWLPAMEAFLYSPRGKIDVKFLFDAYLVDARHFATLLAPDFWGNPAVYNYFGKVFYHEQMMYLGIPGLILGIYSFFIGHKYSHTRFFRLMSAVFLSLGFIPLGWVLYYSQLPFISSILPSRIFLLFTFGFSVLAGFGMEDFLENKARFRIWFTIFWFTGFALAILWGFVLFKIDLDPLGNYATISSRNLVLPSAIFLGVVGFILFGRLNWWRLRELGYLGLTGLSVVSSLYFANKYLYFSDRKFVYPEVGVLKQLKQIAGINRIWGYGNGYLESSLNLYYDLYSTDGYDAVYSKRYGELLARQEREGRLTGQSSRSDSSLKQASEYEKLYEDNSYRKRLMSLLGVKYIFESKLGNGKDFKTTEERFARDFFDLVWEDESFRIWEYKEALPRTFLVYDYTVEKDKQKRADLIFDKNLDLGKKLVLEEESDSVKALKSVENVASGRATVIEYLPNKVTIETETTRPALLFLSDNFYPGWEASINGVLTKIYRADYSFRAIVVPTGRNTAVFAYKPKSFLLGRSLSIMGILSLGGLYFKTRKKRKK